MSLQDELVAIERSLWRNDADIYERRFLPDSVMLFGETGRLTLPVALAAIREENETGRRWEAVEFSDVLVSRPLPNAALLTYFAEAHWNDSDAVHRVFCATLYVEGSEGWRVAFHQQTPDARSW